MHEYRDSEKASAVSRRLSFRIWPGCRPQSSGLPTWTILGNDAPTQNDPEDLGGFVGWASADEFRVVTRSHVLAWRAQLDHRGLAGATIRRKLAAPYEGKKYVMRSDPDRPEAGRPRRPVVASCPPPRSRRSPRR